jgi:hypothetical protein
MNESIPYWSVLLRHFENRGYIHNGLTIPFLIGARKRMEPQTPLLNIRDMVNSINEVGGTVLECPNIREFVIGSLDTETLKYKSLYPKCIDNILITDNSLNTINNIQELISHFEQRYQTNIDNCEYSKNDGEWTDFIKIDEIRIDEINYR